MVNSTAPFEGATSGGIVSNFYDTKESCTGKTGFGEVVSRYTLGKCVATGSTDPTEAAGMIFNSCDGKFFTFTEYSDAACTVYSKKTHAAFPTCAPNTDSDGDVHSDNFMTFSCDAGSV